MDPADTRLGRLLQEEITPLVMVLSTPLAEEACRKSGLNVVQLLRPFCVFHNIDVPVRTTGDQPYRLQNFRLRLFYASEVRPRDPEVSNMHLKEIVSKAGESDTCKLQTDSPRPAEIFSMAESEVVPSWIHSFNRDFSRALSFSDHEVFDHPVSCLLVVSSEDEQPMNKFVDLFNTNQLPVFLSDSSMDPKIPKHYLLLHDKHVGTTEKATRVLAEMRTTFGLSDCRLLCINSRKDGDDAWEDNPWVTYRTSSSSKDDVCCLGIEDYNEIRALLQDLSSKRIIPHMETKIRILDQQVSATRKGFRNQIKNLWWRKGKEDAQETPDGPTYTFSSIESQIRILGDYAFMLHDYELALSNYRLLSTDYRLDKAWKRYAGVQEMVGLSLFMLDQSRKDSEYAMESAFNTYLRIGSAGLRNAARCGLWWTEMLKARDQYKEAAIVYFRMSHEEPSLHAAVLLEQAAYCYLFSTPRMLRKFGFHLFLAGNRYFDSDQKKHAIRTYGCALSVYRGNVWSYISDHVHYNIGRWYAYLEMFDAAIMHMLEILECTHQSLETQEIFLNDFLHIVEGRGKMLEVPNLQLPCIIMSSLKVIFEDHRTYASSASVHVRESLWQTLEENLIPSSATNKSDYPDYQNNDLSVRFKDCCISVVGEAIKVHFELRNPLQISISVTDFTLVCEYTSRPAVEDSDDSSSANGVKDNEVDVDASPSRSANECNSSFELSTVDVLLGGGQTREIQLSLVPKMEGYVKIVGVKWILSKSVIGYQRFDIDAKRKARKGRPSHPFRNMLFLVIKGLPRLEGSIRDLPEKTCKGDLRLLMLELRNDSDYAVKNLKMKISQPRFLIPGNPEHADSKFPVFLQRKISSIGKVRERNYLEKCGGFVFTFPSDVRISGGAVFRWPLWLHAAVSGNLSVHVSIYYEMDNLACGMNYRILRMHHQLEVLPSIDVSIAITPCPNNLQEFLVRMDVTSKTDSESFWLDQLSSVGSRWKILPLPSTDLVCPLLLSGQNLSWFFKLKDSGEGSLAEHDMLFGQGSDLRFTQNEDEGMNLDISRTPLADFHNQERLQEGKTLQEHPGSVDFILISRLVEDGVESREAEHVQLLSHHACYCSISNRTPIHWLIVGPRTIIHDFSAPFCEINFYLKIQNCSETIVSVKIVTFDTMRTTSGQSNDPAALPDSYKAGWHEISFDPKVSSDDHSASRLVNTPLESSAPFVWCASSSTKVELQPTSFMEVPLSICVFAPGVYDLSNYELHYSLQPTDTTGSVKEIAWQSSGTNRGHPHHLTVLNPTW